MKRPTRNSSTRHHQSADLSGPSPVVPINRIISEHKNSEQKIVDEDGMLRPRLSLLARNYRYWLWNEWKRGNLYQELNIPRDISEDEEETTIQGLLYKRRHHMTTDQLDVPVFCRYQGTNSLKVERVEGFENIARAYILHIYETLSPSKIERNLCVSHGPFRIEKCTKLVKANNDPRGIQTYVVATTEIQEGQVIGIYEGQWLFDCENKVKSVKFNPIQRYKSQWKIFESQIERRHPVDPRLVTMAGVKRFMNEDGTLSSTLLLDGDAAKGAKLCDFREDPFDLDRDDQGPRAKNIQMVEVKVMEWPVLFAVAIRNIQPEEELLIDYTKTYWDHIIDIKADMEFTKDLKTRMKSAFTQLLDGINMVSQAARSVHGAAISTPSASAFARVILPLLKAAECLADADTEDIVKKSRLSDLVRFGEKLLNGESSQSYELLDLRGFIEATVNIGNSGMEEDKEDVFDPALDKNMFSFDVKHLAEGNATIEDSQNTNLAPFRAVAGTSIISSPIMDGIEEELLKEAFNISNALVPSKLSIPVTESATQQIGDGGTCTLHETWVEHKPNQCRPEDRMIGAHGTCTAHGRWGAQRLGDCMTDDRNKPGSGGTCDKHGKWVAHKPHECRIRESDILPPEVNTPPKVSGSARKSTRSEYTTNQDEPVWQVAHPMENVEPPLFIEDGFEDGLPKTTKEINGMEVEEQNSSTSLVLYNPQDASTAHKFIWGDSDPAEQYSILENNPYLKMGFFDLVENLPRIKSEDQLTQAGEAIFILARRAAEDPMGKSHWQVVEQKAERVCPKNVEKDQFSRMYRFGLSVWDKSFDAILAPTNEVDLKDNLPCQWFDNWMNESKHPEVLGFLRT